MRHFALANLVVWARSLDPCRVLLTFMALVSCLLLSLGGSDMKARRLAREAADGVAWGDPLTLVTIFTILVLSIEEP